MKKGIAGLLLCALAAMILSGCRVNLSICARQRQKRYRI